MKPDASTAMTRRSLLGAAGVMAVFLPLRAWAQPDLEVLANDPTRSASAEAVVVRKAAARSRFRTLAAIKTDDAETARLIEGVREAARFEALLSGFPYGDGGSVYPVTYRSGQHSRASSGKADAEEIRFETARIEVDTSMGVWQSTHLLRRALLAVEAACAVSEGDVRTALEAQIAALTQQLALSSDARPGVIHLPDGEAYARAQFGLSLGRNVPVEAMLKRAHKQLEAIWAEADTILRGQGMRDGTAAQRLGQFARNPRFLYPQTEDGKNRLVADMNRTLSEAIAILPQIIDLPTAPEGAVVRMSAADESAGMQGKRDGTNYVIDLRRMRDRPAWSLPSVVHHELYPGHMLHNLMTPPKVAALRKRYGGASGEGWPVYAETVAAQLSGLKGLDRLGFLHWQAFRYARIVVDIGLNVMGWSRDEAIAAFRRYQGPPVYFITFEEEVDRMCLNPGAAAAQGYLALAIADERDKRQKLAGFDLKAFHAGLLSDGPFNLAAL